MASCLRKRSIILFLCMQVSRAVINRLSITNPHYSKKGVDVTIPWNYTDDDKDLGSRKWYFKNASMTDFKLLFIIFGTGDPTMSPNSPLKNIVVIKPATLLIKNPNFGNEGTYRFSVSLKIGRTYRSDVHIIITDHPTAVVPDCPKIAEINEGENLTCLCKGEGGKPSPTASWVKDGKEIDGTGKLTKTLSIKNVTKDDAGVYTCKVVSHDLTNETQVTAYVRYSPTAITFSSGNKEEVAHLGKKATITCKAEGYPKPAYSLLHNGTQRAKNINGGLYTINRVKFNDAGIYKCVAENTLGNVTKSFTLTVSGGEPPTTVPTQGEQTTPTSSKGDEPPTTVPTQGEQTTATSSKDQSIISDKDSASTPSYIVGITCFIGGLVCGMILLYVIQFLRRRLKKETVSKAETSSANYEDVGAVNVPTYQELDLTKMDGGENYQSLEMNRRSLGDKEEPQENEAGYTELNKVRGNKDENYQVLNRV